MNEFNNMFVIKLVMKIIATVKMCLSSVPLLANTFRNQCKKLGAGHEFTKKESHYLLTL